MSNREEYFRNYYQSFVGKDIGGYKLRKLIGVGGMGAIFLACNPRMDVEVAMKILLPEFAHNTEYVERFFREARNAFKLKHENIVAVHHADVVEKDKIVYMTMDLIVGSSLKDILKVQKKLSVSGSLKIILQTLNGLSYAHRSDDKVVHRDIKPDNIMINNRGVVKIADFGLARGVSVKDNITLTGGQILGTPSFMSPEQWDSEKTDSRADIYSLGATFYYMLTGEYPYKQLPGGTIWSIRTTMLESTPQPPSEFNPEVDSTLDNIIMKMLDKDVNKRYQTCEEVLDDIEKWQKGDDDIDLSTLILSEDIQLKTKKDTKKGTHQVTDRQTTTSSSILLTPKKAALFGGLIFAVGIALSIVIFLLVKGSDKEVVAENNLISGTQIPVGTSDVDEAKPEEEPKDEQTIDNQNQDEENDKITTPDDTNNTQPVETQDDNAKLIEDEKNFDNAKAALLKGNPKLMEDYIKNSTFETNVKEAKRLLKLKDDEIYSNSATIEALENYLSNFRKPEHQKEAERKLKVLKDGLAAKIKLQTAFEELKQSKDVNKLREFIKKLPVNSDLVKKAEDLLEKFRWEQVKNADDPKVLDEFEQEFPFSVNNFEIPNLKKAIEIKLIDNARNNNDVASWKDYLAKFPKGKAYLEAVLKIAYPEGAIYPVKAPKLPSALQEEFEQFRKVGNFWETKRKKYNTEMVYIPPGRLYLGDFEGAKVYIEVKPFLIDKYEVNIRQYEDFCKNSEDKHFHLSHKLEPEDLIKPITELSYQDAQDYAKWVGGNLPSEIDFLWAAIGPNETQKYLINDVTKINISSNSLKPTTQIANDVSFFGVIGLAGNAKEILRDAYTDDMIDTFYRRQIEIIEKLNTSQINPLRYNENIFSGLSKNYENMFIEDGDEFVIRGASFLSKRDIENPDFGRNARRSKPKNYKASDLGFRTIRYIN